jgi:3-oxoadipate enol-lactonase
VLLKTSEKSHFGAKDDYMPYFEHCGAKLYYEEKGSGNPLIFLHGASLDMRQWDRQADYFSKMYRVVTMDARGHGKSTLPPGPVSPDVFWQDVIALMDFLKIEKAVICGLSMGGHVALQVAINAAERVNGIILIGTICTNKFNLFERVSVPINRFSLKLMPMKWLAWSIGISLARKNAAAKAYIQDVVGSLDHDAFNRVWKAITSMESRAGLSQIKCPTLILIGDRDTLTKRQQQFIHLSIPGSQLVTVKNAHHCTNLDNPEQVEYEIEKFLQKL